jgi:hypothetical protein
MSRSGFMPQAGATTARLAHGEKALVGDPKRRVQLDDENMLARVI